MQALFSFVIHAFILFGICGLGFLLCKVVATAPDRTEKLIRAMSIATGVFLYGAAKAMGASLAAVTMKPEAKASEPASGGGWWGGGKPSLPVEDSSSWLIFPIFGILIPCILGLLFAKFTTYLLNSKNYVAVRILLVVGSVILLQFFDLYIQTSRTSGLEINQQLVPNLLFFGCFGLYLILRFKSGGNENEYLESK